MIARRSPEGARIRSPAGHSLFELMCAMTVLGVLAGILVGGLRSWFEARAHAGSAAAIQSVLREAQQRALAEGRSICVDFGVTSQSYAVYRTTCDARPYAPPVHGPLHTDAQNVRIAEPAFGPSGSSTGVTFLPRGTASSGSVKVFRDGSSRVYEVTVDGLTGRISRG